MPTRRYAYRLGARSWPVLRLFGVAGDDDAWVDVGDDHVEAHFGWAHATIPLADITGWRIEGPWRWITAIGIRRSIRHGDLTFGGSHRGGVRLDLRTPVAVGPMRAPALYVTVEDVEGLAADMSARGIPGEDVRRSSGRDG